MKKNLPLKYFFAILILLNALMFSSCMIDVDVSSYSKTTVVNPLAGIYKMRGSMYNYSGHPGWVIPSPFLSLTDSLTVPPGYISRIDLSPFSPKMATVIDSLTVTFPFANFVSPGYYYNTKTTPYGATSITFDISPGMNAIYSNVDRYIRAYTWPLPSRKPSWRFITQYNDGLGGTGNDHIVDEVFEQQ